MVIRATSSEISQTTAHPTRINAGRCAVLFGQKESTLRALGPVREGADGLVGPFIIAMLAGRSTVRWSVQSHVQTEIWLLDAKVHFESYPIRASATTTSKDVPSFTPPPRC